MFVKPQRWWVVAFAGLLLGGGTTARPAPPDEDTDAEVPGLIASFSSGRGPEAHRVVPDLGGRWGLGAPDARVPSDDFRARWEGLLLVQAPGSYRFAARTDGAVTLKIADRVVPVGDGGADRPGTIELPAGFSAIALEYRHGRGEANVALDWEGPGFGREPVPARLLFHDPANGPRPDRFEEGRRLADRLGCANCHGLLDLPRHPHLGPALADAGRAIDARWLNAWLVDPTAVRRRTRMPAFGAGLRPGEAADLSAFLRRVSPPSTPVTDEVRMALNVADRSRGRLLFRSLGCLGCHSKGDPGPETTPAPDLGDLAAKRTESWLAAFLEHPRKGRPSSRHRPDFRLSPDEAAHLAAYLASGPRAAPAHAAAAPATGDPERGRAFTERARCASCHEIPGLAPRPADLPLGAGSRPGAGCLADAPAGPLVPRFALSAEERGALREFVAGLPRSPSPTGPETLAEDTVRRLNCLGCHTRDGRGGEQLGTRIASLLADDPALGGLKGTLTPPNLSAAGDKLRPEYLGLSIRGQAPPARPWLSVRMPQFPFEAGEADAIASYFQGHDRMRAEPDPQDGPARPDLAIAEAAATLIGQRGFGCISCHVLAGRIPPGGEPETLGPDLALAHRRMSRAYFQRWIANPQRIIAGTPMPQFVQPVATLPGTLDDQLATIWQLLGSPRVAEVAASGTREILKREGDRPLVVRDMVLLPDAPETPYTPRALAIGLKNDHSLLFDTDRLTWLAWWHRGFLSRTKSGRLWEWHPEGERLWIAPKRLPPIVFLGPDGAIVRPDGSRGRPGGFTELDFEGPDLAFSYWLLGPEDAKVRVRERIRPIPGGWERQVDVSEVPPRSQPALVEQPPDASWSWPSGGVRVTLVAGEATGARRQFPGNPAAWLLPMTRRDSGGFTARIRLKAEPEK